MLLQFRQQDMLDIFILVLSSNLANETVATYFSHVMSAIGGNTTSPDEDMLEEASNAMALDGIIFEGARVKRLMLQPAPIGPPPTKVLSLMQVVTEEELINDEDYEEIMEDMKIECGKFGKFSKWDQKIPTDGKPVHCIQ
ncbi:splicing factor U2af large subunit B-like protein isoform X1 [Tanacetum coccineum]